MATWDLSTPLLQFSAHDKWTIGNAVENTLIVGGIGSGKTSGSGEEVATSFLRAGLGGMVLTAKNADGLPLWERMCRRTGRLKDLIVFGPNQPWRFNFINYELQRKGAGAGLTENIVNLFSTIMEIAERGQSQGGGHEDGGYWRRTNRQLCRNGVDLLALATGSVSIPELYRLIVSAPTSLAQLGDDEWKTRSFCFKCLAEADKRPKTPRQLRDFELVVDFFCCEYPSMSEKTRSVIVSTFTSMVDVLNRGVLRELFCSETNVTPEVTTEGKIILFDMPVKEYGEVGQIGQVLFKYAFQRSIERRDVQVNPRPVFLWQDEPQFFVTSYDMQFQSTSRAARVAVVLLTQNISNFYAALGGNEKGRAEADSLFGCTNTKIFHANSDPVTNEWAAKLIGRTKQFFLNANSSNQSTDWFSAMTDMGHTPQNSAGVSESYEFEIQPSVFTTLRTGGAHNQGNVDAIVFENGRIFQATGRPWLPVTFKQHR